jgi:hypothetical protein
MASEGDKGYETYHTESPAHRYLTSLLPEAEVIVTPLFCSTKSTFTNGVTG